MKFRSMLAGILSRRNTASLAFIDPKLRALPLSPLLLSRKNRNAGGSLMRQSSCEQKAFLRRHYPHQVKGRSWMTSSQPASTSSPVFIYRHYIPCSCKMQENSLLHLVKGMGQSRISHRSMGTSWASHQGQPWTPPSSQVLSSGMFCSLHSWQKRWLPSARKSSVPQ